MLPTPSTSHIDSSAIYEPAEDSYLFLDTLSSLDEVAFLKSHFPATIASPVLLEVGTGSGVVLAFLTAHAPCILGRTDVISFGIDINPQACLGSAETVRMAISEQGGEEARWVGNSCADLGACIKDGTVDVLIFNPPYVPTEEVPCNYTDGSNNSLLELAWAGGKDGMEVTDRLLADLGRLLSERGVAYVLLCAQNLPEEVKRQLREEGWKAEIVGRSGKVAGWEKLVIVRIWKDLGHNPDQQRE